MKNKKNILPSIRVEIYLLAEDAVLAIAIDSVTVLGIYAMPAASINDLEDHDKALRLKVFTSTTEEKGIYPWVLKRVFVEGMGMNKSRKMRCRNPDFLEFEIQEAKWQS